MVRPTIIKVNKGGYRADLSWLGRLEAIIVGRFKIKKMISLALVSPGEMIRLNGLYRGRPQITDVLSFNITSDLILGEIIICLERARRQAKERGRSLGAELKTLTIHGILHLLGYDHERSIREARRQEKVEKEILSKLT